MHADIGWDVLHSQDWVGIEIVRYDPPILDLNFLVQSHVETKERAALDLAAHRVGIEDRADVNADIYLQNLQLAIFRQLDPRHRRRGRAVERLSRLFAFPFTLKLSSDIWSFPFS